MRPNSYRPAWWVPGAHARTLWGKLIRRHHIVPSRLERWDTPDGDFLDIHRVEAARGQPRLVVLHGLEGTHRSHYVRGILAEARRREWEAVLVVFRSCGSDPNRSKRFYHSGETTDLSLVVERLISEQPSVPLVLAGFSLGGNVLLKWLGEGGNRLPPEVRAAAAVSVPFDLARSAHNIERGFARLYQASFVRSLVRKTQTKLERFPDLVDANVLSRVRTLRDFDGAVTAPVHGFASAEDYYMKSSALRWIAGIRLPTLLLSAEDDPFLPRDVLNEVRNVAARTPALDVEFVRHGGHVGFISGAVPWRPMYYAEWRVADFLASRLESLSFSPGDGTRGPRP